MHPVALMANDLGAKLTRAFVMAGAMGWQMLWALILGFTISSAIQVLVSKKALGKLLPDASPRSLLEACGLGAASSSCSYAAAALSRTIFRKGADFTAAMVFEIASTNFVVELGVILVIFMGWAFMGAELVGGVIMVVIVAVLYDLFLPERLVREARKQADKGLQGKMEGHAAMDMSASEGGSLLTRALSAKGMTAISQTFVMEVAAVYKEILVGLALSAMISVFVPKSVWSAMFLEGHPLAARLVGPFVGPLVAVLSFVCSVGNVPLAAVLWNKGISFGGVISFLFADLIILPILNIYRKYYGAKMAAWIFGSFYLAMAFASLAVEALFAFLHLTPTQRTARVELASFHWNYTTFLNLAFLVLAALLVVRFVRSGGPAMMKKMREMKA